jgi:hypothetical protein
MADILEKYSRFYTIKSKIYQKWMLGNGCSYAMNFGHSKVLIKITDKMPLLLAPREKFVTLNIFDRKFSVDFPTREDWSTECVDLVAPDGLVFFNDGSFCESRAAAGVFSDILNVRESYVLFWRVLNIAFRRALSTEQYQSALICVLLCWPLNRMPCLPELYYSAEILFRNWLCLKVKTQA